MKTSHIFHFSFLLLTMVLNLIPITILSQSVPDDTWKLAKDKDGMRIYTSDQEDSKLKMFKVHTQLNTSIEHMVEVLQDVEDYPIWTDHMKHSSLLEQINENEFIIYSVLDMPWPFDDRDVINKSITQWSEEKDTALLIISCLPDYLPKKKGIVRMPYANGAWHLFKVDEANIRVEYSFAADPAGSIPKWVVNLFIVDGPYKTIINLRAYLKKKYGNE